MVLYWAIAFLIIAPLSISSDASLPLKITRLALTIGACVLGLQSARQRFFGENTRLLLLFVAVHLAGALWSRFPIEGIFWKSFFPLAALAGLLLAASIDSPGSFKRSLRVLCVVALLSGLTILGLYLRNPGGNQVMGRLSVGGMNANSLGQAATPLFLIGICVFFTDADVRWKKYGLAAVLLNLILILATGSRGAILACLAGSCVPLLRIMKEKAAILVVCMVLGGIGYLFVSGPEQVVVEQEDRDGAIGLGRLDSQLTKDTRSSYWGYLWRRVEQRPFLGYGWCTPPGVARTLNCMNIFLQAMYEEGIVGLMALVVLVRVSLVSGRRALRRERLLSLLDEGDSSGTVAASLLFALWIHGMVESSTILGTTTNSLFLGFSLGLLDRHKVCYGKARSHGGKLTA